jgi:uncharacterized alpha-E superfamily protein
LLSRTADSLFWLARYVERAENVARMVAVAHRMESVARSLGSSGNEWLSTLIATGCESTFFAKYSEAAPVSQRSSITGVRLAQAGSETT